MKTIFRGGKGFTSDMFLSQSQTRVDNDRSIGLNKIRSIVCWTDPLVTPAPTCLGRLLVNKKALWLFAYLTLWSEFGEMCSPQQRQNVLSLIRASLDPFSPPSCLKRPRMMSFIRRQEHEGNTEETTVSRRRCKSNPPDLSEHIWTGCCGILSCC